MKGTDEPRVFRQVFDPGLQARELVPVPDSEIFADAAIYRKRPVEVRAVRVRGWPLTVKTLEGEMVAEDGDWLIRGTQGEVYPCKDAIFREVYETPEGLSVA